MYMLSVSYSLTYDLTATVLNPPAGVSGSNLNYNSVTIAFEFGDFRYLTTGDAERDPEQRMGDDIVDCC